jgi:hypothetical protein
VKLPIPSRRSRTAYSTKITFEHILQRPPCLIISRSFNIWTQSRWRLTFIGLSLTGAALWQNRAKASELSQGGCSGVPVLGCRRHKRAPKASFGPPIKRGSFGSSLLSAVGEGMGRNCAHGRSVTDSPPKVASRAPRWGDLTDRLYGQNLVFQWGFDNPWCLHQEGPRPRHTNRSNG